MVLLQRLCNSIATLAARGLPYWSYNAKIQGSQTLLSSHFVPETNLLSRCMASLASMHRNGPRKSKKRIQAPVLDGSSQKRGVVLKVLVKKPKKPNSANRKCVRIRLTNGKEATAFVPGEGHNLQEHSVVLVYGARLQDVPGVKLACVRGKYDLAHVKKKET